MDDQNNGGQANGRVTMTTATTMQCNMMVLWPHALNPPPHILCNRREYLSFILFFTLWMIG
jgi:hypothetical protein